MKGFRIGDCFIKSSADAVYVGLDTIAAAIGEDATTIEDVYEPYLMQIGFLSRTPRGRMVTPAGYRHLGLPIPGNGNQADDDQLTL